MHYQQSFDLKQKWGRNIGDKPVAYRRKAAEIWPNKQWRFAERPMTFRRNTGAISHYSHCPDGFVFLYPDFCPFLPP